VAIAPPDLGRRERKKEATREALIAAAVHLFTTKGYDATTVEDIAEVVDVSSRTFHRYFASKEDVLFADADERLRRFDAALAERPDDEDVLESLRIAAGVMAEMLLDRVELEAARHRLFQGSPALRAQALRHTEEWARVVAEHTASRLHLDIDDPLPQLLGGCTAVVMRTARQQWAANPSADLRREIDRGFDMISHLAEVASPQRKTKAR
jgi:AcrR family transcriptional regulator